MSRRSRSARASRSSGGELGQGAAVGGGQHECLKWPHGPERHHRDEVVVGLDHADPVRALGGQVVAEQAASVLGPVGALPGQLPGRLVRDALVGPDLPVRVRVAGAHHRAAVLEDLHVAHPRQAAEFAVLVGPGVHDLPDGRLRHHAQREVVAGVEADHPADAALGLGDEQAAGLDRLARLVGPVGQQRREVVVEHVGGGVARGGDAAGPGVARAEVAVRVVRRAAGRRGRLHLALPRAGGAVRRHQDPLAGELVEPPVRSGGAVLRHRGLSSSPTMLRRSGGGRHRGPSWCFLSDPARKMIGDRTEELTCTR